MKAGWCIACDGAELAVECARAGEKLSLPVEPRISQSPVAEAVAALGRGQPAGIAVARPPSPADLVHLSAASRSSGLQTVAALIGEPDAAMASVALAGDMGLVAVDEIGPLASVIALIEAGADRPWAASLRALPEVDRVRLPSASADGRGGGRFARTDDGRIGWSPEGEPGPPLRVGEPRELGLAIAALRAAAPLDEATEPLQLEVDPSAVLEVIFGPPRALSDPASKAALGPYGLPVPVEELCTSPSRAAAEAARIGFPVRIALASPDLRVWDHPDLASDGVDNAARVRDVFRQMTTLAKARAPSARLLGVTVTATAAARALLRVAMQPLARGLVLCEVGFADPHGVASGDHTHTVLPASTTRIERVLGRLAGSSLLLDGGPIQRRAAVNALTDVLQRLAAFVHDRRNEVEVVEIDPLALLVGGGVEVREACVTVGDAFLRSLEAPATGP